MPPPSSSPHICTFSHGTAGMWDTGHDDTAQHSSEPHMPAASHMYPHTQEHLECTAGHARSSHMDKYAPRPWDILHSLQHGTPSRTCDGHICKAYHMPETQYSTILFSSLPTTHRATCAQRRDKIIHLRKLKSQ